MLYRDIRCEKCGQNIDNEEMIRDYEKLVDEKAGRIATLLLEIDILEKRLEWVTRKQTEYYFTINKT